MTCPVCGYDLAGGSARCPRCGRDVAAPSQRPAASVPQFTHNAQPPQQRPVTLGHSAPVIGAGSAIYGGRGAIIVGALAVVLLIVVLVIAVPRFGRVAPKPIPAAPNAPVVAADTQPGAQLPPYAEFHGPPPQVAELQQPGGQNGASVSAGQTVPGTGGAPSLLTNSAAMTPQSYSDLPRVGVDDLAKAYAGDYVNVTPYDGKRIVVTGAVGTTGSQAGSQYVGIFASGGQEVLCIFPPDSTFSAPSQGSPIAIAGKCDGSTEGTITMSNCALATE